MTDLRAAARSILDAALAVLDPRAAASRALRVEPVEGVLVVAGAQRVDLGAVDRVLLVGAGRDAAAMAHGALDALGDRIDGGSVVAPHGTRLDLPPEIDAWEAADPVPDAHGLAAAASVLGAARGAGGADVVLCLLSPGASALWTAPPAGVSLTDVVQLTDALLRTGVPAGEADTVRRHLSRVAGGRLAAAAAPARVVTLAVADDADVTSDTIGGGPTSPDPTTFADALEVLRRHDVDAPPAVLHHLQAGDAGEVPETPGPDAPVFERVSLHPVAGLRDALDAAAREAERRGFTATVLADATEGAAHEAGARMVRTAREAQARGTPTALLLGGAGWTTTSVLAAAAELGAEAGITVAALGGGDVGGPTAVTGADVIVVLVG